MSAENPADAQPPVHRYELTLTIHGDTQPTHLAEHHAQGYCRLHGVHRSVCGCRRILDRLNLTEAQRALVGTVVSEEVHALTARTSKEPA